MAASHEVSDCERFDIAVLVVDDDATTLSVNAAFLRSWNYKVATATSDHEALETLREFRGFFDLVITDLNIRGMNGFELQKTVKSEFHLPVIIMSEDGRKSVMSRSLEQGAAFCLVKPVRREDLRDVWQYAVAGRREKLRVENGRIVSVREEEEEEGDSSSSPAINIASTQDSTSPKKQRKKSCKRKRSDDEVVDNEELIFCGPKRSKIFWTVNLHSCFLLALRHLGMDKAAPTKILEIMNVPGLTRENVASHLQKYRLFLKRIAEKGILEGLPERALRSRFAMGLPTDLIRDIQKRLTRFHEISYYHQPYSTYGNPQIPQNPPTTRLFLANQTRLAPPNYHGGTNHTYGNFQQPHYHNLHRPIVNGGGFMTSANNGLMSNYSNPSLVGNNRSFNHGPTNYYNSNNNPGMLVPYGSSGLQPSPGTCYNNHHGTQLMNNNNNRGMTVPYGSHGFQPNPSTYYNNHYGTQLNNDNASLTVDELNVQNVGYTVHNRNGSASNNAVVPVSSSSVANVRVDEPTRANISASLNPSFPNQQSMNGIRNAATSVNQREVGQMDDLNELFLMLDDMVSLDKTAESPRAGERSTSDILSSFNVEDYIELLQGDGDHVNAQTRERSISVLPNKSSSSCTNENPNMLMRNDSSTNLGCLNMFVEEKANSPSANSTPREQDWDMDLIETLFFDAADPSLK